METSNMWQILPVWNKEASSKMSSQRKSESVIIQSNPIGNRELVGVLPNHTRPVTPSATQDPLIDTESDDDVSSSVVTTRKMTPVDNTLVTPGYRCMIWFHIINFLMYGPTRSTWQAEGKHFALAKGYYQLVNELNHYKGHNSVQNSSIRGYQDSSMSAALSECRSRLAKIEPSIVTNVVSFIFKTKNFRHEHHVSLML